MQINKLVWDEIDDSLELAALIDAMPRRIFDMPLTKVFTRVMHFEPDLSASLRKKAEIMETTAATLCGFSAVSAEKSCRIWVLAPNPVFWYSTRLFFEPKGN